MPFRVVPNFDRPPPKYNPWTTAGETASVKNACAMYGVTEHDVATADPPIPYQNRSYYGNCVTIVQLSDICALRNRLREQKQEDEKKAVVERHGRAYYDKMIADRDAEEERLLKEDERKVTIRNLDREIRDVFAEASAHGMADTLEGRTISKTNAKKDWYVNTNILVAIDSSNKKTQKYNLSQVIGAKRCYKEEQKLETKLKKNSELQRLRARYLLDKFVANCQKHDDDDAGGGLQTEVYENARTAIAERIAKKEKELRAEKESLAALESVIGSTTTTSSSSSSRSTASPSKRKTATDSLGAIVTPAKTTTRRTRKAATPARKKPKTRA